MIALAAAFTSTVQDPDFWWHLRTGYWMLDHGRLPSQDLFTYTVGGHSWVDHEYLTEVILAYLNSWGGLLLISIVFAVLTYLGFVFIYRTAPVGRRPYVIAGLGLALAALAGAPIWGPRAQMITFTLTCLELYWIASYLSGRSRLIYYLPLVVALWANLHGGFVIAFVLLAIAIGAEVVYWILERVETRRFAHRRRVRTLVPVLLVSLVASLTTPHGLSVSPTVTQTLLTPSQRPPNFACFTP